MKTKETAILNERKFIIDCDPGIDDAVAICAALQCPEIEVLAITGVEGCVPADQVTSNIEFILELVDPPKRPRLGAATRSNDPIAVDTRYLHGSDGLGNIGLTGTSHLNRTPSEKILADQVRQFPGDVSIICLGPLTNIANLLRKEPVLATSIDRLYIVGGSLRGIGNITPAAEFNMYFDPVSAREVFHSAITKTLIPLELTSRPDFGLDFLNTVAESSCPSFLHDSLKHLFSNYHQHLGRESISLNDAVGLISAIHPELISTADFAGDVEPSGEITRGVTVFDQRTRREWRTNIEVGTMIEHEKIIERLQNYLCR